MPRLLPLLSVLLVLGATRIPFSAEPPTLGYRGVFQPDGLAPGGPRSSGDIWRLTLLEARETVSETATIIGYEWLTPSAPRPWNLVHTYTGTRPRPEAGATLLQRPGDFYYFFPIFDQAGDNPPPPAAPSAQPYQDARGGSFVTVTPEPRPAPAEKVFVRYTLETVPPPPLPPPPAPGER